MILVWLVCLFFFLIWLINIWWFAVCGFDWQDVLNWYFADVVDLLWLGVLIYFVVFVDFDFGWLCGVYGAAFGWCLFVLGCWFCGGVCFCLKFDNRVDALELLDLLLVAVGWFAMIIWFVYWLGCVVTVFLFYVRGLM